ncbi:MAG: hypothetical protein P1V20_28650, partial [Verrucomicrobiales bacterium]|nr:hypothetical protein [Verrucomicrobiales bacterium]
GRNTHRSRRGDLSDTIRRMDRGRRAAQMSDRELLETLDSLERQIRALRQIIENRQTETTH